MAYIIQRKISVCS